MTLTDHGAPYVPSGSSPGGHTPPPAAPWGYAPAPPPPRRSKLLPVGLATALVIAIAALAVAVAALVTRPAPGSAAPTAATLGDTNTADRALCTAIAPLMAESIRVTNAYVDLGAPGTAARDAATGKFAQDVKDWIGRIQPILDQKSSEVDPFFHRSLQRYIDDQRLWVADIAPGPLTAAARALYADGTGAYAGPLRLCEGLGVTW